MTIDGDFVSELLHSWNISLNVVQSLRVNEIFSSFLMFLSVILQMGMREQPADFVTAM